MITIRKIAESDLDALCELEAACFSTPWSRQSLQDEIVNPSAYFIAAESEGVVCGYAGLICAADEGFVTNIAVLPQYRRQGVGRALVKALADYARESHFAFITLEVRLSNMAAISLYTSLGFQEMGERKNFYTKPVESAMIMTLFL